MSLRWTTPCDEADPLTGQYVCPYMDSSGYVNCEWWCSAEEPEPDIEEDDLEPWEVEYEYIG